LIRPSDWRGRLCSLLLAALVLIPIALHQGVQSAIAAPVDWQEVEPTNDGRQWWDRGSVRRDREGFLSVLSRYTPQTDTDTPTLGKLYVMQIDCDQNIFRDKQVNGLPRWRAQWEPAGGDGLIERVIDAVCRADLA
jgi:hypothetical protein